MRRRRDKLTPYATHMIKALLGKEMKLLRVYPYESRTIDVLADTEGYSNCQIQKDSVLYKRLTDIRKYADKYNMNDNKIVIQVSVKAGYCNNSLFLGFWDHYYSIGTAVVPCEYAPKEFPTTPGYWNGLTVKF